MRKGFTLIELLASIAVVALLASVVGAGVVSARRTSRDLARVTAINEMGRFLLAISCYEPKAGPGEYDLQALYGDLVSVNPNVARYITEAPRDPKTGTETESGYRYLYTPEKTCALYANLENPDARVTLPGLTSPTPGVGSGTLRASADGPSGGPAYYQIAR